MQPSLDSDRADEVDVFSTPLSPEEVTEALVFVLDELSLLDLYRISTNGTAVLVEVDAEKPE
jgi:hypothetical protein